MKMNVFSVYVYTHTHTHTHTHTLSPVKDLSRLRKEREDELYQQQSPLKMNKEKL